MDELNPALTLTTALRSAALMNIKALLRRHFFNSLPFSANNTIYLRRCPNTPFVSLKETRGREGGEARNPEGRFRCSSSSSEQHVSVSEEGERNPFPQNMTHFAEEESERDSASPGILKERFAFS